MRFLFQVFKGLWRNIVPAKPFFFMWVAEGAGRSITSATPQR